MHTLDIPVVVVGGGAVGAAVAKNLSADLGSRVALLERNLSLRSDNQTGRSSQVLHAGILYDPKFMPNKARHCVRGNRMAYDYCIKQGIPHAQTHKLVVATNDREEEYVAGVKGIAEANDVPGVHMLTSRQIKELEPSIHATMGIYVPTSGIVDAVALAASFVDDATGTGACIMTGNEVVSIEPSGPIHEGILLHVRDLRSAEEYDIRAMAVVNCAGLYAVSLAKQLDPSLPYTSRADRGEAACFSARSSGCDVKMNVYRAPCGYYKDGTVADVPFQDLLQLVRDGKATLWTNMHFTRTLGLDGELGDKVTICPLKTPDVDIGDFGTGKPLKPVKAYHDLISPICPGLQLEHLSPHQSGNMVVLNNCPDFVFHQDARYPMLSLLGIGTPGLASALSIAEEAGGMVRRMMN
ncbi:FAD-dependent oxidoreductase [Candidatus Woesearchaeota archaeon]|nr:FAD-dependent oxidoreductase [Candidatus Woesearchaeota archaeon]